MEQIAEFFSQADKWRHITFFFVLGCLLTALCRGTSIRTHSAFMIAWLAGIGWEWYDTTVGKPFDMLDVLANTIGCIIGWTVLHRHHRSRPRVRADSPRYQQRMVRDFQVWVLRQRQKAATR